MNWSKSKTWSLAKHLALGAAGAALAYALPYAAHIDWSIAGPLAPLVTVGVSMAGKALLKWLEDEQKESQEESEDDQPTLPAA